MTKKNKKDFKKKTYIVGKTMHLLEVHPTTIGKKKIYVCLLINFQK